MPQKTSFATIGEYVAAQDPAIQPRLSELYRTIVQAAPGAQERMSWQMPTFHLRHNLVHFAAGKHHIGFYPGPDGVRCFQEELADYKTSKGAIQFPNGRELPLGLVAQITAFRFRVESQALIKEDVVRLVRSLGLENGSYHLAAGCGLLMHGVRQHTRDVDIGCTTPVIDRFLAEGGKLSYTKDGKRCISNLEPFEFFEDWPIDAVEQIDGITVGTLDALRRQKLALGRPKDLVDVERIDQFIQESQRK